jgi:hypothetical protein
MSQSHGNTPAAWSAVVFAMIGFVIGGVGLMLTPINLTIFWIGMAVIVAALPLFAVMNKMGLGERH